MKLDTLNPRADHLQMLHVPDAEHGDLKLNLYPIKISEKLPEMYSAWQPALDAMLARVPAVEGAEQHYITIDSKFFTVDETQRREGIHIDGNFCADPDHGRATWGGTTTTWADTRARREGDDVIIETPWVSPYGATPPLGTYVSDESGGMLVVSNHLGCKVWPWPAEGVMGDGGDCSDFGLDYDKGLDMQPDVLYFVTSDTPHDSILIEQGNRRTFMRLTLNHKYPNANVIL